MQRYVIKLAYNGSNYHGWQMQENAHTVQSEINEKLSIILKEKINVVGCGRTDTGVHASEFYAHFDSNTIEWNFNDLVYKLNGFLPSDIVIFDLYTVPHGFNTRFDALSRTYSYYITLVKNPFNEHTSYYFNGQLNIAEMNKACCYLLDYTDYTSFSKLHTQTATNNCNIENAGFELIGNELIFTITANRFLRNMVRAIVGTMIEIGKGKISADDIKSIIEAKDRGKAGFSVPAHGLFLEKVVYNTP